MGATRLRLVTPLSDITCEVVDGMVTTGPFKGQTIRRLHSECVRRGWLVRVISSGTPDGR